MDGLLRSTDFADMVAKRAGYRAFTVFDVGCSGGIDPAWRVFGERLVAYGFGPDLHECERLRSSETLPGVHYVPRFVAPEPDDAFLLRRASSPVPSRNVWWRLSGPRSLEIRRRRAEARTPVERRALNLWQHAELASAEQPVALASFAGSHGIGDVDFIKIDVDGEDFAILNAIGAELGAWNVLGLGLEVSFDGSEGDTEQSFHNTDRFMRAHGFDLFGLSIRRYSHTSLPGIYAVHMPAETLTGRPQLGDAIYLRDLPAARNQELAQGLEAGKILKLAAIASLAATPDFAADILVSFRDRLEGLSEVPRALDLLALQLQSDAIDKLSYQAWMAAFEADDPILYSHARPRAQAAASVPVGSTGFVTCGPQVGLPAGRYVATFAITDAPSEEAALGMAEIHDAAARTCLARRDFRTADRDIALPFAIAENAGDAPIEFRVRGFGQHGFSVRMVALEPDRDHFLYEIERLRAELAAMRGSLCWQLTAPLRRLRRLWP